MKARSICAVIMVLTIGTLATGQALAQTEVSVQNPSFAWTGKSGQDANYRWSATVDNPSGRELNVRVAVELLDANGNVVARDTADVMLPRMDRASVEQTASITVATAETATEYRVVLTELE